MNTAVAIALGEGRSGNGQATILVVDDDQSMRELLKLHLQNHGYRVLLADDAVTAGHLVVEQGADLVIVDVEMPYMNGYEFVAAMKADPSTRELPIVFLTSDENVSDHAKKLGAAAYLNKPVVLDRLLEVIALFVERAA